MSHQIHLDLVKIRIDFEKCFSQPPYEFILTRHPPESAWLGSYRDYAVQCAWEGWNEAHRKLLTPNP